MPDPASDNSRMNPQFVRQVLHSFRSPQIPGGAFLPFIFWNQSLACYLVSFLFLRITRVLNIKVIVKSGNTRIEVAPDMCQFVHQDKPEIVHAIMPKRQSDYWTMFVNQNCRTVKVCLR